MQGTTRENIEGEIRGYKIILRDTDYIAIKMAEGAAMATDYAEVLEERANCRSRINELEAQLAELVEEQ